MMRNALARCRLNELALKLWALILEGVVHHRRRFGLGVDEERRKLPRAAQFGAGSASQYLSTPSAK
jgi:hypothetical protein